ncbi:MAG: serine/threonine-protein kinase [Deltaproteobacteria bacterium]|jgi:serine/threonine protein kinase|nr:serine/threonine-protein kinase [Deltaproteobacteria bacterium]
MAEKVSLKTPDGRKVEFLKGGDFKSGGMKDVYFSLDGRHVVAFYREPVDGAARERLEKLVGSYRRNIFGMEGGNYYRDLFRWPESIVEHGGRTGIVVPIYDRRFFFSGGSLDGAEKEGKWFSSAKNFNMCLSPADRGSLLGFLKVCLSLTRAVKRLHSAGLAHSDLSYKNVLIDPSTGSACVIDIDGLVVPGLYPPDVVGTTDFIAPEVVGTLHLPMGDPAKKLPCVETDLHALAVLIYHYLLHRHPLRGNARWSDDQDIQEKKEMGELALFIEHPDDPRNRKLVEPNDGAFLPWIDTARLPFTILGPFLQDLFVSAFVHNLHNPPGRPIADDWEDALVKTTDLLEPCGNASCPKGWYVVSDPSARPVCPYCGTPYPFPSLPYLDLYSSRDGREYRSDRHRVIVFSGLHLYRWHVSREVYPNEKLADELKSPVGYFMFHNGEWILVNQSLTSLMRKDSGEKIPVNQALKLRAGDEVILSAEKGGRVALVGLQNYL